MNLNATLLGQMITFAFFVWFTMKYVWPPIIKALHDRQKKIAEGLAAAERGVHELELAQQKAKEKLREAKIHANDIIDQTNIRALQMIEDARLEAKHEAERILAMGKKELQQEVELAKQALRQQIVDIAIRGAERILKKNIDKAANSALVEKLITEI